ncbi:MAG: ATP-binding cassette domain-containing protein, partial [Gammaproteobacteria bacterium]|nr:ATP-binding cassette domain-containing protein [Gammaproteobacteria bacterium]
MAMLSIKNLCKSYHYADVRQDVLHQLQFEMSTSSSVALLGESGSGKSTLLHLIAGLDRPDSGEIHFAGYRVHSDPESVLAALRRSQMSLVFQQFHLISTLSILDNIRFQAALCQRFDNRYEAEL